MSLFKELKRRNVFKVTIAYIVMAWLVMQVADVILNNIVAPGWIFHVLLLFLAIGLPFAVFFAWAFEMTPEGLKRESEVDRSQSITTKTGRKLDFLIIGVLVLALGYFAYDKLVLSTARDAALVEATTHAVTARLMLRTIRPRPEWSFFPVDIDLLMCRAKSAQTVDRSCKRLLDLQLHRLLLHFTQTHHQI